MLPHTSGAAKNLMDVDYQVLLFGLLIAAIDAGGTDGCVSDQPAKSSAHTVT